MKFNKNVGTQEEIFMKKAILNLESGLNDNAESVQWLIDNAVTVDEDGAIVLGNKTFTPDDFDALYELIHPTVEG